MTSRRDPATGRRRQPRRGRAPAFAQAAPKKLVFAHIVAPPESSAVAFAEMAEAVNKRAKSGIEIEFHGGTLLSKELGVINAIKAGNIAIGDPRRRCHGVPGKGRFSRALSGQELRPGLPDV